VKGGKQRKKRMKGNQTDLILYQRTMDNPYKKMLAVRSKIKNNTF